MLLITLLRRLGPTLLLAAGLVGLAPSQAQDMLEGCQLVNGTLQCVPGVTADPQQQIRDLRQQISADQNLETAVEQQITADALAGLPPSAFHWYRLAPGSRRWVLIQQASGPSYMLTSADVNARVMVVVAVPSSGGSQRQASPPLGPVSAGP